VQVLAGVVEADDLGGPGELRGGDVPDPGGAVAEDGELADVVRAAADAPGPDQVPERRAGSKVAMTLAEARSRTGQPSASSLSRVKKTASLASRVRARPSSPFPSRPAVSFAVMGTPVPSMAAQSLSGSGDGGRGTTFREAMSRARSRPAAASAVPLASFSGSRAAPANGPAAAARSFIAARPGDIDVPATPSSSSRGARPCPQSAQWYQARRRATGPGTVSMTFSR
jgi:hypothetical protein